MQTEIEQIADLIDARRRGVPVAVGHRCTGKSTALIKWMRDAPSDELRVGRWPTKRQAMEMLRIYGRNRADGWLDSWQFLSFDETLAHGRVEAGKRLVVGFDDAEMIIENFARRDGGDVGFIALTGDPVELPQIGESDG
jgi:hypothetical protein